MEILKYNIEDIKRLIISGNISTKDILDEVFVNINRKEDMHNCYISLRKENAYCDAESISIEDVGKKLLGIPIAVKDNICTKGIRTTCGSKMLNDFIPGYSAYAYERLIDEGAILIGKTNMDEFAMGNTNENSAYGIVKNPYDIKRTPGGSSGGSAAAVALGECKAALGTDTGGSVRLPASFCGVCGIKPTYGTISRYGLVSYASSLEQIGVLANNVEDMATVLDVVAGYDKNDSTSIKREHDYLKGINEGVKGFRIAVPVEYMNESVDSEIISRIKKIIDIFKKNGATIDYISIKTINYSVPAYYIIASAEASSNLYRYDGVKYGYRCSDYNDIQEMYNRTRSNGFGDEVKKRIMLGTFVLSREYYDRYYIKASKVRRLISDEYRSIFSRYDLIIGPVSTSTAGLLGDNQNNGIEKYMQDLFTVPANLTGIPAASICAGYSVNGLPIGIQLMAGHFSENKIIRAANLLERCLKEDMSNE